MIKYASENLSIFINLHDQMILEEQKSILQEHNIKVAFILITNLVNEKIEKIDLNLWSGLNNTRDAINSNKENIVHVFNTPEHSKPLSNEISQYKRFIITVQDPIERVLSQIKFDLKRRNPKLNNLLRYFGSVDNITKVGLRNSSKHMQKLAEHYDNNRINECQFVSFVYFSKFIKEKTYEYYTRHILDNPAIELFLLRINSFTQDKTTIKVILSGGDIEQQQPLQQKSVDSKDAYLFSISEEGKENLCELLCVEITIYQKMITKAKNMNQNEKLSSITKLKKSCPKLFQSTQSTGVQCKFNNSKSDYYKITNVTDYQSKARLTNPILNHSLSTRTIGFVHIGKCGGTSASRMIRRKCLRDTGCNHYVDENEYKNTPPNESQISLQVQEYFHAREPLVNKYNTFIVTMRHPVKRLISWFIHAHPENKILRSGLKLTDCYKEIDDLATVGLSLNRTKHTHCHARAKSWIQQNLKYGKYTGWLLSQARLKEIFVLRTEYFWKDWYSINAKLGGTKINVNEYLHTTITHKECTNLIITNKTVSKEGIQNLCYYLCTDIKIYKRMIFLAKNLDNKEKRKTLKELGNVCPIEASNKECEFDFRKKDKSN